MPHPAFVGMQDVAAASRSRGWESPRTDRSEDNGGIDTMSTTTADPSRAAAMSPEPAATAGFWHRYGTMWRSTPKELLAILLLGVLGTTAFALMWALVSAGLSLLFVLLIGGVVIVGALYAARGIGEVEMRILEWTGRPRIARPAWPRQPGFLGWLRSLFGTPHYWLAFANYLLPQFIVSLVTVVIGSTAVGIALGGTTWVIWSWALPREPRPDWGGGWGWAVDLAGSPIAIAILRTVLGLLVLFALPFIARGLVWAHWGLARVMLGAFRSDALEQELVGAEASRAAAVAAEDTALRRIERDIHDGPQQRLIRLQMDLASAQRRLEESPEESRALLAAAATQAGEALDELRALSRGFAPPILLDRGLVAALESAAARVDIPVDVVNDLPADTALPPEIERNAYFIASEGLTNAVKHAGASRIAIGLTLGVSGRELVVTVRDDGAGGAQPLPRHGIAGLEERLTGLGGSLTLASPEGGPTLLTARLPW